MQDVLQTADAILTHHPEVKMVKQEELRERVGKNCQVTASFNIPF